MNWLDISSAAVTLFLIMDPLGNAPLLNSLLSNVAAKRRMAVMVRELLIALAILLGFLFAGNSLLSFLGLTQSSLNISGGVLLFIIALRLIFPSSSDHSNEQDTEEPFIVPIAMPCIAGPSTIALLLLLSSNNPEQIMDWSISLFLAWFSTALILVASPKILAFIGKRGSRALGRLMGMILIILATQMLLNGVRDFIVSL